MKVSEGEVDFHVPNASKPCKTWYKIVGDLASTDCPLVTLHGGPGMACEYLTPLQDLNPRYGTTVVFYDQLGCGRSTHLQEKNGDTAFWTAELFINELNNLLEKLNIIRYDLYGQSWGGMLGSLIASQRPKGLRKLIISNSPAKMSDWAKSCAEWRVQLPKEVDATLLKHEQAGTITHPDYEAATNTFYERHVCRALPWAPEINRTFDWLKEDPTVYHTMNGPTEFHVIGPMKNWDTTEECKLIEVETLVISARYDEGKEFVALPFFKNIEKCKWVTLAESSHLSMWEERERYNEIIGEFLRD